MTTGSTAKAQVAMMIRTHEIEIAQSRGASYGDCFRGPDLRRTLYVDMCCTYKLTFAQYLLFRVWSLRILRAVDCELQRLLLPTLVHRVLQALTPYRGRHQFRDRIQARIHLIGFIARLWDLFLVPTSSRRQANAVPLGRRLQHHLPACYRHSLVIQVARRDLGDCHILHAHHHPIQHHNWSDDVLDLRGGSLRSTTSSDCRNRKMRIRHLPHCHGIE